MQFVWTLLAVFSVTFAVEDFSASVQAEDTLEETDLRDSRQNWRALDYFPLSRTQETSGWIPHEQLQPQRRRRLRKRKRRPPVFEENTKPQFLDEVNEKETWAEMVHEMNPQPYHSRRRISPVYEENSEKIRDPFTALIEAEEKQKKIAETTTQTPDLKTLLKQSGSSLSLSEILQQKNLSLSELLMGKQEAILALTEKSVYSDQEKPKYERLPPSIGLKKNIERVYEDSTENLSLTSDEVLEAQRKRLNLLNHGLHKDNKLEVTEDIPETTTVLITTTTIKPKNLPMTSAKLNKLTIPSREKKVPQLPENAVTISINEIFGFRVYESSTSAPKESDEGPLKMTLDLGDLLKIPSQETTTKLSIPLTQSTTGEKLKHVTAKEEIGEILRNPTDREHLSNILKIRNMTVEELVEQRERGSSQLHLADIFHNNTREPEPKEEASVGVINSAMFTGGFGVRQQKSREMSVVKKESATIKPTTTKITTASQELYSITSFPTYKIEMNKNLKEKPQPFLPWQELYPSIFVNQETQTTINYDDLKRLEDIENTLADVANDRLNVDIAEDDERQFINIPSGVKSAIFASLAIIGLSLVVFLTILVVFKWTQRQKRRLNYSGSFSGSKIKSPILESEQNKRSFRTFMTETLGRKKNYYKAHLQSMSDNIWESEKKSYMI